jgi:hypothetical protein
MNRTLVFFGFALLMLVGTIAILYLPSSVTSNLAPLWWNLILLYFLVDALIALFPTSTTATHTAKHHARWHVPSTRLPPHRSSLPIVGHPSF